MRPHAAHRFEILDVALEGKWALLLGLLLGLPGVVFMFLFPPSFPQEDDLDGDGEADEWESTEPEAEAYRDPEGRVG